jgi:hypothetical protein
MIRKLTDKANLQQLVLKADNRRIEPIYDASGDLFFDMDVFNDPFWQKYENIGDFQTVVESLTEPFDEKNFVKIDDTNVQSFLTKVGAEAQTTRATIDAVQKIEIEKEEPETKEYEFYKSRLQAKEGIKSIT